MVISSRPIASVDDESAPQSQHAERFCKFFDKIRRIDAHNLAGGMGRIG